jgi:hypothetical protein
MKKTENFIYVTGDMHGDLSRFRKTKKLKKGDFLLVCGDFGFVWDGCKKEKQTLKRLGKKKFHILFADGVHENFKELEAYPEEEFCGGKTRLISGNLRYLMRGEIFTLAGKKVLVFGGGRPDDGDNTGDKEYKILLEASPAIPREADYRNGLQSIARHGGKVDYIVSHMAPVKIAEFLELPTSDKSRANAYLDILGDSCAFERWFFGNHHINKVVTSKYYALFDRVMRADEIIKSN